MVSCLTTIDMTNHLGKLFKEKWKIIARKLKDLMQPSVAQFFLGLGTASTGLLQERVSREKSSQLPKKLRIPTT